MANFKPRVYVVYSHTEDDFRKSVKGIFVDYLSAKDCLSVLRKMGVKCSVILFELNDLVSYVTEVSQK